MIVRLTPILILLPSVLTDTSLGHSHSSIPAHSSSSLSSHSSSHSSLSNQGDVNSSPIYPSSYSSHDVKCSRSIDVKSVYYSIQEIDYKLHTILKSIPPAIEEARTVLEASTLAANRDAIITGIACFIGAVSGGLSVLYNKDVSQLSSGDQIKFLSFHVWGYGYYGPFLLELSEIDPGCGVEDFNKVVYEYNFVTSLHQVYGSNPATSGLTSNNPDDRPEIRKYYIGEFSRKLKLALHCITSQSESVEEARLVSGLIDKYVNLANQRLDLTQQLM